LHNTMITSIFISIFPSLPMHMLLSSKFKTKNFFVF
jgi:hypothetical protein